MMNDHLASQFATEWIAAWNAHDLDRILEHYSEDVQFSSPFVVKLRKDSRGTVHGKEQLRSYFTKALENYPELHFELLNVLVGVHSVTLCYHSVNNLLAAEVMQFNGDGKVSKVLAHYSPAATPSTAVPSAAATPADL